MPKYYGCPCEGCGKPLTLQDDIVVCPDCGAPYHRVCYEKLGQCIHRPAHVLRRAHPAGRGNVPLLRCCAAPRGAGASFFPRQR